MRKLKDYAVYRADKFLCMGTAAECASFMGWKDARQTQWFASPSYQNKVNKCGETIVVIRVEDDDE